MFRKNLSLLIVIFGLLFNIQAGFTHGVEHIVHDHESHESSNDHESHENSKVCEECLLINNLVESSDLNDALYFNLQSYTNFNYNYDVGKKTAYTFVAYQSQAP